VLDAFSGGTWDPAGYCYCHGAGHSDGANNGMYRYNFLGDLPYGWSTLSVTADPATMVEDSDPQPDGRPVAVHTYAGMLFDPDQNRVHRYGGSQWSGGGMPSKNWRYDVAAATWSQGPNTPYGATTSVCSVINNNARKALIISHAGDCWFHDLDANTNVGTDTGDQQAFDSVAAYDPTRSRAVVWAPSELWRVEIDWVANTTTWSAITPSGSTAFLADAPGAFFYDWDSDVFWFLPLVTGATSMANVYSMNASTWAITQRATSGDNTGFVYGGAGHDGNMNKICVMLQWRLVGFITGVDDTAYLMKLPIV
jgi:hypothetical protein